MRKLLLVLAMLLGLSAPAVADNRINWYYALNPPVDWMNYMSIYHREADGQKILDFMGGDHTMKYTNMSLVPQGTGWYGEVTPGNNQFGSIYEYTVVDAEQTPPTATGTGSIFIAPNSAQIMNQATLLFPTQNIGPFTPPGTVGQGIVYMVEGQIQTADSVSLAETFYTKTGTPYSNTVTRERDDTPIFQTKAGTASTSPAAPTVDSGWVCIATITVPYGTPASLSGATVTPCPAWQGFAYASNVAPLTGVQVTGSTNITGVSTAGTFVSTIATGTPPFTVTSTTPVTNLSIGGNAATATSVTGIVPIAHGGTGTATPALVAGSNISVTGTFPGQTVALSNTPTITGITVTGLSPSTCVGTNSSSSLASVACGGLPSAGTNITVSGATVSTVTNPVFAGETLTGVTSNSCLQTNSSNVVVANAIGCFTGITAGNNVIVTGTPIQPIVSTTLTPSFVSVKATGLAASSSVCTDSTSTLTTTSCSGSGVTVSATSPITASFAGSTYTIGISSTPTFTGVNVSGLAVSSSVCTDASSNLTTTGCASGGATLGANTFTGTQTIGSGSALGVTFTGTTSTITSNVSGTSPSFIFNEAGGSTGNLFQFNLAGTAKVYATSAGALTAYSFTANNGAVIQGSGTIIGGGSNVSLTAGSGYEIIGSSGAANMGFDAAHIQARAATNTYATLYLNSLGGGISTGTGGITSTGPLQGTSITGSSHVTTGGATFADGNTGYADIISTSGLELGTSVTGQQFGIINTSGYQIGSSSYGPSGSTVAGGVNATQFIASDGISTYGLAFKSSTSSGYTGFAAASGVVAGIAGSAMQIDNYTVGPLVALDTSGDFGVTGSFYSASERRLKDHITDLDESDADALIDSTNIVRFCYRIAPGQPCASDAKSHIGFIADDTPIDLAPGHRSMDYMAVDAVLIKEVKELRRRVADLEALFTNAP